MDLSPAGYRDAQGLRPRHVFAANQFALSLAVYAFLFILKSGLKITWVH